MKTKLYLPIISLLAMSVFAFISCDDSDSDTTKPVIELSEPEEGQELKIGDEHGVHFEMDLSDDVMLKSYMIEIHSNFDHHSHGKSRAAATGEATVDFSFNRSYDISGKKTAHIHHHDIIIPANACGARPWSGTAKCSRALCALRSEPAVFADGIKRRVILLYSEQKQALAAELSFKHPAVLAVSGSAGSGKTALLAALLPVLKSRGLKVGVIREADDLRLPAETDRLHEAGAEGVAVFTAGRYLLTEQFRLNEQDLLALFERHGYDLVLLEGFGDSGWAKIDIQARGGFYLHFEAVCL